MFASILLQFLLCLPVDAAISPVDFDTQVMPILTKSGCNTGACHGAAAGRGGFFLSLYGSRPDDDYDQIVRAMEGRRIDAERPELSLILQKPTEQLSHEGGTRIELDGPDHQTLLTWLNQGARRINGRRLTEFDFKADNSNAEEGNQVVQLHALASFDDGTVEPVVPWTVFSANDPSAVEISESGQATILKAGRHVILARYLDRVAALELLAPFRINQQNAAVQNFTPDSVDAFVDRKIQQLGLQSGPPADEAPIVRRLSLDLTGRLPQPADVDSFVASSAADKTEQLIDDLLRSDHFVEFWTFRLAGALRVPGNSPPVYYAWIRDCLKNEVPFDEMARQLLLAEGELQSNGPANFYPAGVQPKATAELASNIFLGIQLQCANCHDHPLDQWTQDDYHGLAAIFATVSRGPVVANGSGYVIHPQTGEAAIPKIPGGRFLSEDSPHREKLADWVTAADSPYFKKAIVNRTWNYLMGRGLVEPIDDLRSTNPATHPELLNWLAMDFGNHQHSLRHLIRTVCLSNAYQRSCSPPTATNNKSTTKPAKSETEQNVFADGSNASPTELAQFYCVATAKLLNPAVFHDAVNDVCESDNTPRERHVSYAAYRNSDFARTPVGRCEIGEDCSVDQVAIKDLAVQLAFVNGELLNDPIRKDGGALTTAISSKIGTEELVNLFFRRAYSRTASARELKFWTKQFHEATSPDESKLIAEDFLWSILTSNEFLTNH
ncbi:MAG: DUF1549 domain-containing protein [Fuerstiella sp.]